ncbi:MAG: hypothetical protein WC365_09755 [Candidatus Babeliales bacterium]|jgi:hypothetical protein
MTNKPKYPSNNILRKKLKYILQSQENKSEDWIDALIYGNFNRLSSSLKHLITEHRDMAEILDAEILSFLENDKRREQTINYYLIKHSQRIQKMVI